MSDEKPWWFPELTDAAWVARIRADYPEDTQGLDDDTVRDEYADGMKYADTWDHLGDARGSYEPLADAYLALLAEPDPLLAEMAEALEVLIAACDDSDSAMYGALGVRFVRDVVEPSLSAYRERMKG